MSFLEDLKNFMDEEEVNEDFGLSRIKSIDKAKSPILILL